MNNLIVFSVTSVIIQFIVEMIRPLIPENKRSLITPYCAMIVGIWISFSAKTGLFAALGIEMSPAWTDYIVTGIAYSGGSAAFNELISLVSELRPSKRI